MKHIKLFWLRVDYVKLRIIIYLIFIKFNYFKKILWKIWRHFHTLWWLKGFRRTISSHMNFKNCAVAVAYDFLDDKDTRISRNSSNFLFSAIFGVPKSKKKPFLVRSANNFMEFRVPPGGLNGHFGYSKFQRITYCITPQPRLAVNQQRFIKNLLWLVGGAFDHSPYPFIVIISFRKWINVNT